MKKDRKKPPAKIEEERFWKNPFVILAAVLLLAFSLRFIFFYEIAKSPIADMVIEDSKTYHDWASRIAGGDWLGKDVFFALPLYPYFLGLIYTVAGVNLQAARFIQVVLGTVNCWLIFLIGRRFFSTGIGLLAAFLMSVYGWLIVYDSAILSPVMIIFLDALVLLYLSRLEDRPGGWAGWLGAGLLVGLTATASAHIISFIPLVVVWIFWRFRGERGRWSRSGAYLAGVLVIMGAVTFRNWQVGKDFVPLTAHGGINFFIGNNPHSRGVFEPPPLLRSGGATLRNDAEKIARRALGRPLKPSEVSSFWFHQGLDFIKENPGRFIHLLWRKFTIFWDNLEIADVIHPDFFRDIAPILKLPLLVFGVIAPFSLLGLILGWGIRRRILLLYLFIAGYIFSTLLYFVNSRYRLPLVPFLLLFAAYAIFRVMEYIRGKHWFRMIISLFALALLVVWVNPSLVTEPRFVLNMGAGHNHLGTYYSQKGDMNRARAEFEKALQLEPYRPEAHYNLANILFKLGDLSGAEKEYEEAIRRDPFYDSAHLALALVYEQRGEKEKARLKYLEIIHNLPFNTRAYLGLAKLLVMDGRAEEAVKILNKAISIQPEQPEFYLFLSAADDKIGDRTASVAALEKGLRVAPEDGRLHLELGRILSALPGERERSLGHLQEALRLMPENATAYLILGDFYYRAGEPAKARQAWLAARALTPDNPTIEQRLRAVTGPLTR